MKKHLLLAITFVAVMASQAYATPKHLFITGPFKTGPDVTRLCLQCHQKETRAIMQTVHWKWSKKQTVNGKAVEYGKKNAINNFWGAVPSNWSGCTNCHAGYGWVDESFDFNNPENVDCLVCHDTTGTYKKFPGAAGHPVYPGETKEYPKGTVWPPVDLAAVARSVERPNRAACGNCHFSGCGEDGAKHGDLDSTLANPTPEQDVHMGKYKLTCESCHQAANHDVKGEAISVSFSSGPRAMACMNCHKGRIHPSQALNNHLKRVACQTCHIPRYARTIPTMTSWDWSTAGKDLKPEEIKKDSFGKELYRKDRGSLTYGKDLVPTYFWYNGQVDKIRPGDKIDPTRTVWITAPRGERSDPDARIFPFKIMKGKQPYDSKNLTLAVFNLTGPPDSTTAYEKIYRWNTAIMAGMKAAGIPYSGEYGWVDTAMVWALNHTVAPKEMALSCPNCHVEGGRLDWKALGYPKDPR
ncbi:cytochrome c [Geomonas sp. Red276]